MKTFRRGIPHPQRRQTRSESKNNVRRTEADLALSKVLIAILNQNRTSNAFPPPGTAYSALFKTNLQALGSTVATVPFACSVKTK